MIGGPRQTVRRSGDGKQCGRGADHTVVGFNYDENRHKPERVIVTPVSENSYMWLAYGVVSAL